MQRFAIVIIIIGIIGVAFTAKSFFSRSIIDDAQSYASDTIEHIVIHSTQANIEVIPTDLDTIVVSYRGSVNVGEKIELDEKITVDETTGTLTIDLKKSSFFNISLFNFQWLNSERLQVQLPRKHYETIKVHNNVGKTSIRDITVNQLIGVNDVGQIMIERVAAQLIEATNNVGDLSLKHTTGEIFAQNDVGNISLTTDEIADDMTFVSNVGKIGLTVSKIPEDVSFQANTSLGNVNIFGGNQSHIKKHTKYIVSLTTDLGNISVREK